MSSAACAESGGFGAVVEDAEGAACLPHPETAIARRREARGNSDGRYRKAFMGQHLLLNSRGSGMLAVPSGQPASLQGRCHRNGAGAEPTCAGARKTAL